MRVIPVTSYPLAATYNSIESAIDGAKNNARQPKARSDSEKLVGTMVVDACWTATDFAIRFSNEKFLHIWASPGEVRWEVVEDLPMVDEVEVQRVGAEPVVHRRRAAVGDHIEDWSALVPKRRGSEFQRLFVNEFGLLVYCRRQLVWWFMAIRRTDLDQPILHVSEDD